jgi:hypothetical protein
MPLDRAIASNATRSDAFVSIHSAWFLLSFLFLRLYCVCCVCGCVCCTPATASLRLSSFFSSFPHSTARRLATAAAYLFVSLAAAAAPAVSSALGKPPANEIVIIIVSSSRRRRPYSHYICTIKKRKAPLFYSIGGRKRYACHT